MSLTALSDLKDYQLVDSKQDVRGWPVRDQSGQVVGKVVEMMVDTQAEKVTVLVLDDQRQIPARDVTITDEFVMVGGAEAQPARSAAAATPVSAGADEQARLPVIEEQLRVSKREVDQGGLRVTTRVEELPVAEEVRLREEHVTVQRRPVDVPISQQVVQTLQDQAVEVIETAEVPVVSKQARVVEEVVIRKDVEQRTETVHDTLRRSEVEVEQLGDDEPALAAGEAGALLRKPAQ